MEVLVINDATPDNTVIMAKVFKKKGVLAKDEFKSPYFFQCRYSDVNHPRGHIQHRKDWTEINEKDTEEEYDFSTSNQSGYSSIHLQKFSS